MRPQSRLLRLKLGANQSFRERRVLILSSSARIAPSTISARAHASFQLCAAAAYNAPVLTNALCVRRAPLVGRRRRRRRHPPARSRARHLNHHFADAARCHRAVALCGRVKNDRRRRRAPLAVATEARLAQNAAATAAAATHTNKDGANFKGGGRVAARLEGGGALFARARARTCYLQVGAFAARARALLTRAYRLILLIGGGDELRARARALVALFVRSSQRLQTRTPLARRPLRSSIALANAAVVTRRRRRCDGSFWRARVVNAYRGARARVVKSAHANFTRPHADYSAMARQIFGLNRSRVARATLLLSSIDAPHTTRVRDQFVWLQRTSNHHGARCVSGDAFFARCRKFGR